MEQSQPYGILITNGEFTAFCAKPWCDWETEPTQLDVSPANQGAVKFVNSAFWGPGANIARTAGTGTVTFSQCHFDDWDNHGIGPYTHRGTAAIEQHGGTLIVSESEFTSQGKEKEDVNRTHLWLSANATKTIFQANIINGVLRVDKRLSRGKLILSNNADDS